MHALFDLAARHDRSREWTTDRDNTDARRFYAGLGARVRVSKLFYVESADLPGTAGV